MPTTLETIKAKIKEFENVQRKYRAFGAFDTEPDGVFQGILDDAINGKAPHVPRTATTWDLYTNSMDCSEASVALHDAALAAVKAVEAAPIRDLEVIKEYLRGVCWRIY
jgi:hypothetical protein